MKDQELTISQPFFLDSCLLLMPSLPPGFWKKAYTEVHKFWQESESLGALVKLQSAGLHPELPIQELWEGVMQEFEYLSNSQMMLTLLVRGPHFKDHWCIALTMRMAKGLYI